MPIMRAGTVNSISQIFIIVACWGCLLCGCGPSEKEPEAQSMMFDVVDSLLGEQLILAESGIQFSLPAGFVGAPDSVLQIISKHIKIYAYDTLQVEPFGCYIDTVNRAGIVITTLHGIEIKTEPSGFTEKYYQSLLDIFGSSQVHAGSYEVGGVYVRNFLVTHGGMVRFHMLCQADSGQSAELVYFASGETYPRLIKHFESSMGTVSRLTQEVGL